MRIMKSTLCLLLYLLGTLLAIGQQKSIPRIDLMPDKPSTYKLLDWKKLAKDYDNLIFDANKTGTYLPLVKVSDANGVNFPQIKNIKMYTFVGQDNRDIAEAINIMPAVVGASLVGVDKTNHLGTNWVTKIKDFFNKANGQNVYLNNYSSGTGGDWWYELMPNIYFYQLYSLYPNADTEFEEQIRIIADRQLDVLYKLEGKLNPWATPNMNHRAFNLLTGQPLSSGVPEPEAAGAIAWILNQAYLYTNDAKYKQGAELALDFLQSWTSNPSYELQLPYGILTAAKLNAERGTNYDIDKFMNWTFSSGYGTLRNWGTIVGKWNGYDMSGLIGEAMDGGDDYAFVMNGYQHAAALAPVAKYDKRYAKALGKWLLNLASASRHFYPEQLPAENQEPTALSWSKEYDANRAIPYESIKQKWNGKQPYAMGDALRGGWSKTDLSLYSGSSVGYMASLISPTNVEGILQIDLNVTDFEGVNTFANYLYYNPNSTTETIDLTLPNGSYTIYDAISETVLKSNVSGTTSFIIKTNDTRLLVLYPSNVTTITEGSILKTTDGNVIDFHVGYAYDAAFRIKAFSSDVTRVEENKTISLHCLVDNADGQVDYKWVANGTEIAGATSSSHSWSSAESGKYKLKAVASNKGKEVSTHEIEVIVLGGDFVIPEIQEIKFNASEPFAIGAEVVATATTNAPNATITWTCDGGTLAETSGLTPKWKLPIETGFYTLKLTLKNELGETTLEKRVQVIDPDAEENYTPIIYYSFNGHTKNAMKNAFHAMSEGAVLTEDAKGEAKSAYRMNETDQFIYTANVPELNFVDQMTISFWMKPEALGTEQYVISHGSWENRYKISLTPEKKIVMTLNTSKGIIDMADDTALLEDGKFSHFTITYNGATLDMYRDGKLVASRAHTGTIGQTSANLTIARKDMNEKNVMFKGVIDEFRLYDVAISADYAAKLPTIWDAGVPAESLLKELKVNGEVWDVNNNYVLPCATGSVELPVVIIPVEDATLNIAQESVVIIDKPTVKNVKFTITSWDGAQAQDYNLVIEKPFEFYSLVSQKWNNVLTVNNNSEKNGGYSFVSYKWYKDGVEIGNRQYYSAGKKVTDKLDPSAEYMVEVTTKEGETLKSCGVKPVLTKLSSFAVYPNPANVSETITVDTGVDVGSDQTGILSVYTLSGILSHQQEVKESQATFRLSNSGAYALKLILSNGRSFETVLIVK